jgi:hypothetical protein
MTELQRLNQDLGIAGAMRAGTSKDCSVLQVALASEKGEKQ